MPHGVLWDLNETIHIKCLKREHSKHQINGGGYDFSYSGFKFFKILNLGLVILLTIEESWKKMLMSFSWSLKSELAMKTNNNKVNLWGNLWWNSHMDCKLSCIIAMLNSPNLIIVLYLWKRVLVFKKFANLRLKWYDACNLLSNGWRNIYMRRR